MAIGRDERRKEREAEVLAVFGETRVEVALDLLELTELAWHDCYGDVSPPDEVIEDMLVVSRGTIEGLIGAARLAVTDWRDLRVAADGLREG